MYVLSGILLAGLTARLLWQLASHLALCTVPHNKNNTKKRKRFVVGLGCLGLNCDKIS